MRCEEIMKRTVECVSPQDSVQVAARRMRDENVGFLPVCDPSRKVIGAVTDRDLAIRVLADGQPATTTIEKVLTREVIACRPEDDLRKAEELMAKHHKSRMICVDTAGRLVGVISLSDIAQREDGSQASQTLRKVSEREAHV
jgi:CBS domain-containing protein